MRPEAGDSCRGERFYLRRMPFASGPFASGTKRESVRPKQIRLKHTPTYGRRRGITKIIASCPRGCDSGSQGGRKGVAWEPVGGRGSGASRGQLDSGGSGLPPDWLRNFFLFSVPGSGNRFRNHGEASSRSRSVPRCATFPSPSLPRFRSRSCSVPLSPADFALCSSVHQFRDFEVCSCICRYAFEAVR